MLRPRAGDYVRDTLAEARGAEPDFLELESLAGRRLQPGPLRRPSRPRRAALAHPRHPHRAISCAGTRWSAPAPGPTSSSPTAPLPRACAPRWLRADRAFLRRTGGLAITLGERPRVATVAERVGRHPWAGAGR